MINADLYINLTAYTKPIIEVLEQTIDAIDLLDVRFNGPYRASWRRRFARRIKAANTTRLRTQ